DEQRALILMSDVWPQGDVSAHTDFDHERMWNAREFLRFTRPRGCLPGVLSVDPHPPFHRRDELGRVVADAILEYGGDLADHARVARSAALQHAQVRELALLDRADLVVNTEDLRAVRRHDLHHLWRRE